MQPSLQLTKVIVLAATALPRMAWAALVEQMPGLEVWGIAANEEELGALPLSGSPTSLLIDLPGLPTNLVQSLAAAVPDYGLLCLVDGCELDEIVALLEAGAVGCLSRDATVPDLARGLIAAGRGEIVLPPALAARALAALARGELSRLTDSESLTKRERDVLGLLARGLTNKDIAQSLFLSVRTVEAHLRNIYGKLGVSSRTEAVLWAVQHGFEP